MTSMTQHPSYRATHATADDLRALAREYGVEVTVSSEAIGYRLDFGRGYVVEPTEEIRLYASE